MTDKEKNEKLLELQIAFATNPSVRSGFDCSAIGFYNWLKRFHPQFA